MTVDLFTSEHLDALAGLVPVQQALVEAFIADAKASGLVRQLIEKYGGAGRLAAVPWNRGPAGEAAPGSAGSVGSSSP